MESMDWIKFLEMICLPILVIPILLFKMGPFRHVRFKRRFMLVFTNYRLGWFFYKLGDLRRELNDFKVQVARGHEALAKWTLQAVPKGRRALARSNQATQVNITRLETKIDNLHQLLWEMKNDTNTSRNKK